MSGDKFTWELNIEYLNGGELQDEHLLMRNDNWTTALIIEAGDRLEGHELVIGLPLGEQARYYLDCSLYNAKREAVRIVSEYFADEWSAEDESWLEE